MDVFSSGCVAFQFAATNASRSNWFQRLVRVRGQHGRPSSLAHPRFKLFFFLFSSSSRLSLPLSLSLSLSFFSFSFSFVSASCFRLCLSGMNAFEHREERRKTRKEKNTTDTPNTKIKGYFLNSSQKYETKIAARREV